MPPLGTVASRLAGYLSTRAGLAAKAVQMIDGFLTYIEDTKFEPAVKDRYIGGLRYAKDELLGGNIINAFRAAKRVAFHAYADISSGGDYPHQELNEMLRRDERSTDLIFAADLAEFFPAYKRTAKRVAESWFMKPLRWVTRHNLDPVDLGLMIYIGAKTGYLKHYWFDVFLEDRPFKEKFQEALSGTIKLILHAAIEVALPAGAAPFYFDNVSFATEAYRLEIEKAKQEKRARVSELLEQLYDTERAA